MAQINQETRAAHWEKVLMKDSDFPTDLIPQVAYILAQDDLFGLDSRSPSQVEFMRQAVDSRIKAR